MTNATIESLRADVSAGRKRLQVAATCAKSTTGASSMGDGESPRLTADAELNYYRLRSGIDRITAQVNYASGIHQDAMPSMIAIILLIILHIWLCRQGGDHFWSESRFNISLLMLDIEHLARGKGLR
ncbi:putative endopeptidase [Escherichia coli O104:H4 str. LB226692]|nr:putative endopeptidase [Escherichia coli O104:H4 str. LB226692]